MQKIADQEILSSQDAAKHAGLYYDWYAQSIPEFEHLRYMRTYKPLIEDFISHIPKGGRVLDLGSGLGHISNILYTRGFHVTGIESSSVCWEKAKKYFPYIDFQLGDFRNFPGSGDVSGVFDRLAVMYLPMNEIRELFNNVYNKLVSGGVFQVTCEESFDNEQGWYPYEIAQTVMVSNGDVVHATVPVCVSFFTKESLVELFMDTGFDVVKVWNYREPQTTRRNLITVLGKKV